MKKIFQLLLFLSLVTLSACQVEANESSSLVSSSLFSTSVSSSLENSSTSSPNQLNYVFNETVFYGAEERQVFEYAYALNRSESAPVVLFLHGGSWIGGDKNMMRRFLPQIVEAGLIYVSMNYRLILTGANYLDMLQDIHTVIETLKLNATSLKIDVSQMAIVGESAGAHLALLYAYRETSPIPIDFVVGLVPPVDFTDPSLLTFGQAEFQLFLANNLMDTNIVDAQQIIDHGYPDTWIDASPIHHLENAVPTLIGYAGMDELIPLSNIERFISKSIRLEKPLETFYFPNSGHTLANDPEIMIAMLHRFTEYVNTYLK